MERSKIFFGLALLAVTTVACESIHNDEERFMGMADIYVRCMKKSGDTLYAPVAYVHSNMYLSKVSMFEPDANLPTCQLEEYLNGKLTFRFVPDSLDFSTNDVLNGVYDFDLISTNNDSITVKDKLLESRIDPVEISKFVYEKDSHSFELEWGDIENADVYVVKLMDEVDGKYLYVSNRLYQSNHSFDQFSYGWINGYEGTRGEKYVVGVFAYEFEDESVTEGNDVNCESVEFREIEW